MNNTYFEGIDRNIAEADPFGTPTTLGGARETLRSRFNERTAGDFVTTASRLMEDHGYSERDSIAALWWAYSS